MFDFATVRQLLDLLGLSVAKLYCVTLGNGDRFEQRASRLPLNTPNLSECVFGLPDGLGWRPGEQATDGSGVDLG